MGRLCGGRGRRLEENHGVASLDNLVWEHDSANRIPERLCARSTWGAGVPKKRRSQGQRSWVQIPPAPPIDEPTPLHSEIATFAFYLKKNGYRDSTIRGTVHALKALAHHVNLLDPEAVKAYLTRVECSINRKAKICEDLDRFYKYKGIQWVKPHILDYKTSQKFNLLQKNS